MPFEELTPAAACEMLSGAGLELAPAEVRVEAREERWVVHLPGQRLAWFARSDDGRRRLATERRVLRLLEARCRFGAPRVILPWADRHHDFRYLVYDLDRHELLDAAVGAYEPVAGHRIERGRVLLYNAACALTFLAHRAGTSPEERPCGRTLAEDLRWSRHAIARALGG